MVCQNSEFLVLWGSKEKEKFSQRALLLNDLFSRHHQLPRFIYITENNETAKKANEGEEKEFTYFDLCVRATSYLMKHFRFSAANDDGVDDDDADDGMCENERANKARNARIRKKRKSTYHLTK